MLEVIYFNQTCLRNSSLMEISNALPRLAANDLPNRVHFLAASSVVAALDNQELNNIFNSGISLCDSRPLGAVLRLKISNFCNIRGSDFLREIIRVDDGTKGHFFLVSDTKIYNSLIKYAKGINPKFKFVGKITPEFASNFDKDYPKWELEINQSGADFVWVGLGSPKQDFIVHHLNIATGKTCIAIGAALEFVSGEKAEAPKFVQSLYLEWFFRLLNDPRRLASRYLIGNFRFLIQVGKFLLNANKTN
jgi:N-acetylglucosaminyldiphosphoundecaprenol N-acetyl-beta-D-mannosaminyltransferase